MSWNATRVKDWAICYAFFFLYSQLFPPHVIYIRDSIANRKKVWCEFLNELKVSVFHCTSVNSIYQLIVINDYVFPLTFNRFFSMAFEGCWLVIMSFLDTGELTTRSEFYWLTSVKGKSFRLCFHLNTLQKPPKDISAQFRLCHLTSL